jgi:hypothetical protein
MVVEIKNITVGVLALNDTPLSIDGKNSIAAGATVTVRSTLSDLYADTTIRAAFIASQIEIYVNSLLVPRLAAIREFDTPQLNYATSRYNEITASSFLIGSSPLNQVFLANNSGGINFVFPAITDDIVGTEYEIINTQDSLITCTCASNDFLAERVLTSPYAYRQKGSVMRFVAIKIAPATYYWAVKNNNSVIRGAQMLGPVSKEMVFPANITNPTNDYAVLVGANDSYALYVRTTSVGNTQLTGIVPPNLAQNREILVLNSILSGGTIQCINGSGSSSANNRFEMDANVNIAVGSSQRFIYNTTRFKWNKA